ncbi:tetratricopeptide repeat protein, partial [Escherichia sp. HC-CC]
RGELVAKAIDVFPQFVRFPNTLEEVAALESIEECWFARHLLACFYYNKRSYNKAITLWQRCVEMSPEFADGWRGLAIHAWNKQHDYFPDAPVVSPVWLRLTYQANPVRKA